MKKQILVVVAALVAGMSVGLLQAEEDGKGKEGKGKGKGDPAKRAEMMIEKLDTDKNGTLSKEEFAASPMAERLKKDRGDDAVDKMFAARDKNSDGQLDKAELSAPPAGGKGKGPKGKGKGPKGEGKEGASE